eukprot:CAMPEP_0204823206 /NCGR_PEP_ID=MMETSP1346-20131115/1297_1 /ASSEMBLY_ACC=CAM_ASM_000771 /TAXON_ID=215587 /ORGANISM="Aplanochytrium stocchinoi, Strain GSBS06" /LENGTH=191 /DNA_ID=CAMNT_0051949757 /DNA_START=306 /DNA_END=881 /DNA_ORIENTATION=+
MEMDASLVYERQVHGKVKQRVFLGSKKAAENETTLRALGITAVVNAAPSQVAPQLTERAYLEVDLYDSPIYKDGKVFFDPRIRQGFDSTIIFIDEVFSKGETGSVLVHCAGGISRSASLVLAWLVASCGMSLKAAWEHVLSVRPIIGPNAGFIFALMDLEKELTGKTTIKKPLSMHQRGIITLKDEEISKQ